MFKNNLKLLLLAGNTLRARAYAQSLSRLNNVVVSGLLYGFNSRECAVPKLDTKTKEFFFQSSIYTPDFSETIEETFSKNKWEYNYIDTVDVNSNLILNEINNNPVDLVLFAGYGGQILKEQHFSNRAKYLHLHPGNLPEERGSTTIYYSILNGRKCTVTAFFMSTEIDAGYNIYRKKYSQPVKGVNIDSWYDNCIRADCLFDTLKIILKKNILAETIDKPSEEYYIIHPVLKHLAILSLK